MTEAEWSEGSDPTPMLLSVYEKARPREFALFTVACCDRIRHLLIDPRSVHAVEVLRRAAEGRATVEEIDNAIGAADEPMYEIVERIGIALLGPEEYERQSLKTRTGPFSF